LSAHLDVDRGAVAASLGRLAEQGEGQTVGIDGRIPLLLPPVRAEALPEVPAAIEKPDANDRYAEVTRRLQMVAGEDSETA